MSVWGHWSVRWCTFVSQSAVSWVRVDKMHTDTLKSHSICWRSHNSTLVFYSLQDCRCPSAEGSHLWEWQNEKWLCTPASAAVDRVSSLVTGGEAKGGDWARFLLRLVRLYLLGARCYPGSCLLVSGQWQEKHAAGADKLVCRFFVCWWCE